MCVLGVVHVLDVIRTSILHVVCNYTYLLPINYL